MPQVEDFARSLGDVAEVLDRKCGALFIATEDVGNSAPTLNAFIGNSKLFIPVLATEIEKAVKGDGNAVLGIAVLGMIRCWCDEKVQELIVKLNEEGKKDNG